MAMPGDYDISAIMATPSKHYNVSYQSKVKQSKRRFVQRFIMRNSSLQHSGMARVNKGSHNFYLLLTFIYKWNEPYLPLLCTAATDRASPHFGWYSFSIPLRIEG